jgi:hypothetical protein
MTVEKDQWGKLDKFIRAIDRVYPSTRELMGKSFLQGISFGLGATIGVSIILAVLTYMLNNLKQVPVFEQIITQTQLERVLPK